MSLSPRLTTALSSAVFSHGTTALDGIATLVCRCGCASKVAAKEWDAMLVELYNNHEKREKPAKSQGQSAGKA